MNPAVYDVEFSEQSIGSGLVLHEADCPTVVGDANCGWAQVSRTGVTVITKKSFRSLDLMEIGIMLPKASMEISLDCLFH